jgi:hypothetical protein
VLELAEAEEGVLQLLLPHHDGLVEVLPSSVHVRQRFLDGSGLVRRGAFSQIVGLPAESFNYILFSI